MQIRSAVDVDKFFDRFENPAEEVECIVANLEELYCELQLHKYTDEIADIRRVFIKKLIMKSYRLGREHANIAAMETIRRMKR